MKKIVLSLIALTVLSACSSSDDNNNNPDTTTPLVSKIVETYEDGFVETLLLTYNGTKIVKSNWNNGEEVTEFTYTGDLITKEEYFFDGELEDVITYEYDTNQRLIKSTRVDSFGDIEIDLYTHNANGTISFVTETNDELSADGTIYFDSNGNPNKKEITNYFMGFESTEIITVTYDNKNEPFKNVTGLDKISFALPNYSAFEASLNNPLTINTNGVNNTTHTYTYNSNNFPATSTTVTTDFEGNYTTVFFY